MRVLHFIFFLAIVSASACNSPYTFKKRGYFKIDFPEKQYRLFDQPGYPYSFEYPVYANIIKDSLFFDSKVDNDWWINIDFPSYNGRIHISYKKVGKNNFDSLVNDAFQMSYKQHTYKASEINDSLMRTPNGIEGIYFTLKGNTATANQFFLTDSVKNFLRGALYFAATPNSDSLSVVNDFFKQDMLHLINTFKWK
ncbi:MAG: hypothetical protein GC171_13615 [Terrimonas sp.]|nr:hypothetical protein [Terrimonas sp.]